jgi:hypothetical protein
MPLKDVTIKNSIITGTRGAIGIYMDGEIAYIAVDGSAHNAINFAGQHLHDD